MFESNTWFVTLAGEAYGVNVTFTSADGSTSSVEPLPTMGEWQLCGVWPDRVVDTLAVGGVVNFTTANNTQWDGPFFYQGWVFNDTAGTYTRPETHYASTSRTWKGVAKP